MTNPEPQDERRSFTSRTPVNDNPDQVVYRRGFVTRHQVSGWRFRPSRNRDGELVRQVMGCVASRIRTLTANLNRLRSRFWCSAASLAKHSHTGLNFDVSIYASLNKPVYPASLLDAEIFPQKAYPRIIRRTE